MSRLFLCLFFSLCCNGIALGQYQLFDENNFPSPVKFSCPVRSTKEKVYTRDFGDDITFHRKPDFINNYSFDKNGRVVKAENMQIAPWKNFGDYVAIYKYYGKDSVLETSYITYKGRARKVNGRRITFRYDSKNNIRCILLHYRSSQSFDSIINEYDQGGFLIKRVRYDREQLRHVIVFKNDEKGNHIQITPPPYEYPANNIIAVYAYDTFGNPIFRADSVNCAVSNILSVEYIYDAHGNWIVMTEYDSNIHSPKTIRGIVTREIIYY